MPVKCSRGKPKWNVKTYPSGARVRFAWCGKKVVEAKNIGKKMVK